MNNLLPNICFGLCLENWSVLIRICNLAQTQISDGNESCTEQLFSSLQFPVGWLVGPYYYGFVPLRCVYILKIISHSRQFIKGQIDTGGLNFLTLTNCGQRLLWDMKANRSISGTWLGVTRMINIQDAAGLGKRAIYHIVIVITNG